MQPKTLFPQFCRRQQDRDAPAKSKSTEAPLNSHRLTPRKQRTEHAGDLLPYEDIDRAARVSESRIRLRHS